MPTDDISVKFKFDGKQGIKDAQATGTAINKALSVTPDDRSIRAMQTKIRNFLSEANDAYDKVTAKTEEWAKANGNIKSKTKRTAFAQSTAEAEQYSIAMRNANAEAAKLNDKVARQAEKSAQATNAVKEQESAQRRNAEQTAKASKSAESLKNEFKSASEEGKKTADAVGAIDAKEAKASEKARKLAEQLANAKSVASEFSNDGYSFDPVGKSPAELISELDRLKQAYDTLHKTGAFEEQPEEFNAMYAMIQRINGELSHTNSEIKAIDKARRDLNVEQKDTPKLDLSADLDVSKMKIGEVLRYLAAYKAEVRDINQAWKDSGYTDTSKDADLERARNRIIELEARLKELQGDFNNTGTSGASAGQKIQQAFALVAQSVNLVKSAIDKVLDLMKKWVSAVKNVATKAWSIFKSLGKNIQSIFNRIFKSISKDSDKAFSGKNLKRALQMLTKYVFGFRSFFFLYRKLRSGVAEGLKNLVQFEGGANETNLAITELRTSLLYLKNAWAAAFAPIINAVYPILVKLMDILAAVGNAIARFMAALTGQATVLQAVRVSAGDYAESLKEAGGSAGSAAKKQKDLNDRLADFDDLNVLGVDKDKTTSGGGGGGDDDLLPTPEDMFERIATPMSDLVKLMQEAWATGDGFRLGEYFAKSLSNGLDKAHDWLTGEGRAKILKIANLIGTTFDGVLSVEDLGSKIGTVLADVFDDAMDFINTVITPERMYKVGIQIAGALNSAIPRIVPKLGETIGNLFKSGISTWFGWVKTSDFRSWGDSFAQGLNNFIDEMNKDLTVTIAKGNLAHGGKTLTGVNGWEMLGINIQKTAQGLITALGTAIANADWRALGEGLGELFAEIDWDELLGGLLTAWDNLKQGLSEFWEGLKEDNPELQDLEDLFRPIADALQSVVDRLPEIEQAISELFGEIDIETIAHWIEQIPDWIIAITNALKDLLPLLENMGTFIADHPEGIIDAWKTSKVLGGAGSVASGVSSGIMTALAWRTLFGGAEAGAGAAGAGGGLFGAFGGMRKVHKIPLLERLQSVFGGSIFSGSGQFGTGFASTGGAVAAWTVALTALATAANKAYDAGESIGYMVENAEEFDNLDIGPLEAVGGAFHVMADDFVEGATAIGDTFADQGFLAGMGTIGNGFLDTVGLGDLTGASDRLEQWGETARYTASDTAEEFYLAENSVITYSDSFVNEYARVVEKAKLRELLDEGQRSIAEYYSNIGRALNATQIIDEGQQAMAEYYASIGRGANESLGEIQTYVEEASNKTASVLSSVPDRFNEMKNSASTKGAEMKDSMVSNFNMIRDESAVGAKAVEENFLLASTNIKTSFIDAWGEIKGSISEGGDLFVALSDGLGGTVKSLLNAMITGINLSITKPLQDISQSFNILRVLDVNGTKPFAGIPYLKVPTIPHLAQGAVIPPNREFMAVLGDQKSGTNIEAPLDTIKQAVADVMGSGNAEVVALLSQLIQVVQDKNLTIGDKEIGRANARYEARQKIIKGTML